jgi:8-oxo-(d)GTP phosphatase
MNEPPNVPPSEVEAAGILIYRRICRTADERLEFLLLRNARHGTWGFPKGRAEPGETALETARRETREETGLDAIELVDGFLETVRYVVSGARGPRVKVVRFFLGTPAHGEPVLSGEHDRLEWLEPDAVLERLRHDALRAVLETAVRALARS